MSRSVDLIKIPAMSEITCRGTYLNSCSAIVLVFDIWCRTWLAGNCKLVADGGHFLCPLLLFSHVDNVT